MGLSSGVGWAKAVMYVVLSILVIPAMLYGYDRAQPVGCLIDGEVWGYAYALDRPTLTDDALTEIPTHAGLLVREGTPFVATAANTGPGNSWVGDNRVKAQVKTDGRRELRQDGEDCTMSAGDAPTSRFWLLGEKVWTFANADTPAADGAIPETDGLTLKWQASIAGISPVAEQIGRNLWPLVGVVLVVGLMTMAVREAIK